ncbi:branched-chain amino acid ABC transporter substrate-binding protein [Burkholderia sp. Bp9142]|uniref:branched-chain amino acid ABC transporter substrate-binding protein n=1 Tax=Burkholderia sp. Bp9142 TaxID=2184573 RepID=UPI000F591DE6|nr:branched-chain amino acid ABC transporter substrate-binding protein [Burkholderia sp. Bp9142]RQR24031.1 branched-chain amino acid ABC transporter substrate-binding protein [Burkholderia sp. Bp9142]
MKTTLLFKPFLLAMSLAAGVLVSAPGAYAGDVAIGLAAGLTGPSAHYGEDIKRGAQLAIEDANSRKLVIGGQPIRFVLQVEDDQGDPRIGAQVAQKLVDAHVAGVVGHFNSGTSIPASRIYNDARIPMVSPAATNPTLTSQGFPNVFRLINSDAQMGQLAGRFAVESLKSKSIAVIDDRTAFGQGIADEFVKGVQKAGGKIAMREYTTDKAVDFRAQLTHIKSVSPDVVFWAGLDQQAATIAKQMRALGIKTVLLGGGSFQNDTFLQVAGPQASEGALSWGYGAPLDASKNGKQFDDRMKSKFGHGVVAFAPNAYDATWVLIRAMQKANSTDPKVYAGEIKSVAFPGITGDVAFLPNGDLKDPGATLYKVEQGKWTPVATTNGDKIEPIKAN